jgi:predicted dehydrogenase
MSLSPLRFGVIGVGDVFPRFQDAIHALSAEATIVAVADVLGPAEAQRRLSELGLSVPYFQAQCGCWLPEEFWELVDAIYIETPNCFHKSYILEALTRGKHVLVEKPIASSPDEAQELFHAIRRHRVKVYCTLHYAHFGISLLLRWLIRSGQLQELGLGRCIRVQGALLETDRRCDWRFNPQISGGDILIDTGGHLLSILYAAGAQLAVRDAAWDTVLLDWPEVEIGGQVRKPATYFELSFNIEGDLFAPGATGHIAVGKAVPKERARKWLRLEFEGGEIVLSFPDRLTVQASGRPPLILEEGRAGWPKGIFKLPYRNILQEFLDHIRRDRDPLPNLKIAVATLEDVFKAYAICRHTEFYKRAEMLLAAH